MRYIHVDTHTEYDHPSPPTRLLLLLAAQGCAPMHPPGLA